MAKSAIKIPVVVTYNSTGTKQAVKGLGSIEKSFKKMGLARKLTLTALGTSITVFAKKSVAAAVADDKAQKTLNQTLKNLGLSYAALPLTEFIDKLQRATGVSEELLRPAMQRLVRATGDVTKAQQLLNLSLDISASTGKSLDATSAALAKSFLGQNQALGRLGIGLTKTELKTKSFEDISKKLTILFAGQAGVAANSYAGQLGKLQVAAQEASETIGFALIKSLERLGDEKGIGATADAMENLADNTANAILGVARLIDKLNSMPGAGVLMEFIKNPIIPAILSGGTIGGISPNQSVFGMFAQFETNAQAKQQALSRPREGFARNQAAGTAATKAQAAAAEKARKKAIADAQKLLALKKQSAAADKLKAIFDMDIIQLTAAKQGKLSAEELARVNALIALKTTSKADDLTALENLESAKRNATFAEIARLKSVVDENKKSNAEILADARTKIAAIEALTRTVGVVARNDFITGITGIAAGTGIGASSTPTPQLGTDTSSVQSLIDREMAIDRPFMPGDPGFTGGAGQMQPAPSVTVNLQGGINIGSQYEFYESVWRAIENSNTFGNSLNRAGTG